MLFAGNCLKENSTSVTYEYSKRTLLTNVLFRCRHNSVVLVSRCYCSDIRKKNNGLKKLFHVNATAIRYIIFAQLTLLIYYSTTKKKQALYTKKWNVFKNAERNIQGKVPSKNICNTHTFFHINIFIIYLCFFRQYWEIWKNNVRKLTLRISLLETKLYVIFAVKFIAKQNRNVHRWW